MNEKKFKEIAATMEHLAKECYQRGYEDGKNGKPKEDVKRFSMSKGFRLKLRAELFKK